MILATSPGRLVLQLLLLAAVAAACSGGGNVDGGVEDADTSDADGSDSDSPDGDIRDGETDSGPDPCGDGVVAGDELCDGESVECTSLAAQYESGTASCHPGCGGFDVSACALAAGREWELVKPAERDPRWATARCNDGTPFGLLHRPGATGSKVWVIYFQGGGFGDDVAFATIERPVELTSTIPLPDRSRGPLPDLEHGIFGGAGANPDFHEAHMVSVQYCSTDFYTGRGTSRRPVAGSDEGFFFAGRHNLRATVEILAQRYGLDDGDPALRVLWGGASAGCIGSAQTADIPAEILPATAADGRLRVLADGAYVVAPPADETDLYWGASSVPDVELFTNAIAYWDGLPLPACASAQRGECYLGRGWYPALTETMGLPVVVAMSNMDEVVLALRGVCTEGCGPGGPTCFAGCSNLTAAGYAEHRARYRQEWTELDVQWLFAWGSTEHTAALVDERWNGPPGASEPLRELVADFFYDRTPPRQAYVNGADL